MNILIISANVIAILLIFLILTYLWLDKKRFHVESQFRAVRHLLDNWMNLADGFPECSDVVSRYHKTKNVSTKYCAIGEVSRLVWGRETPEMLSIGDELSVFLGVYCALAEEYNRRLNSKFTGTVARFLGFKKLPDLQLESMHV